MARSETSDPGEGDTQSAAEFEAVFNEYYARLCEFVYRYVRSREIAHELVQDLFLRLWRLTATRRAPVLTARYLYAAARNEAIKHLRHERVVTRWQQRAASEPERAATPSDSSVQCHELADAVDQAIAELPERCRLVFTMRREQELSNADIAELLGISVKTVESQMTRALKLLRGKLVPFLGIAVHLACTAASSAARAISA